MKSPYHAIHNAHGDAVILIAPDLQDPPELISALPDKWEKGFKTVLIAKKQSMENRVMFLIEKLYYSLMNYISEVPLITNAQGSGLFDRVVVNHLIKIKDAYPFLRGLICELSFPIGPVEFQQSKRLRGITNHSKLPLGVMTIFGFNFLVLKLFNWDQYLLGFAPLLIGLFFIGAIQLFSWFTGGICRINTHANEKYAFGC